MSPGRERPERFLDKMSPASVPGNTVRVSSGAEVPAAVEERGGERRLVCEVEMGIAGEQVALVVALFCLPTTCLDLVAARGWVPLLISERW